MRTVSQEIIILTIVAVLNMGVITEPVEAFGQSSPQASSTIASSTQTSPTIDASLEYFLRPYNPDSHDDKSALEEICANVYNGGDYLPQMASTYVADPACSFLALTKPLADAPTSTCDGDKDEMLAVANYKRLPTQNCAWIEAVRTHPDHRNKGLASTLLRSMIDLATKENRLRQDSPHVTNKTPTNILTCTIESNKGMLRALEKVGFVQCNTINMLKFQALRELPGWANSNEENPEITPQPLLAALGLTNSVAEMAKSVPFSSWSPISSEQQLLSVLQHLKVEGGTCGFLPGLYEYIVPGPNRMDLKQSLGNGLVLALSLASNEMESSGISTESIQKIDAIVVLTKDERITSLKSNWVCSIVAANHFAFEAALWHACNSPEIARQMHNLDGCEEGSMEQNNSNAFDLEKEEKTGESFVTRPFCLSFDVGAPLTPQTFAYNLPRVTDTCVVYSYQSK